MWVIHKVVKKGKYKYAVVPEHPKAIRGGYVLEHRVLMENHLGRILKDDEIVHHMDNNGLNNSISNLKVMESTEHRRLHATTGRTCVDLICPNCGKVFSREVRNTRGKKEPKCSRKCNGEYSRKIQLNRL